MHQILYSWKWKMKSQCSSSRMATQTPAIMVPLPRVTDGWDMSNITLWSPPVTLLLYCAKTCVVQRRIVSNTTLWLHLIVVGGKKIYQHQHFRLNRRWVWRRSDWITRAAPSFSHQTPIHICHPEWFAHPPNIFTEYNKNKTTLSNEKATATWSACGGKNFVKFVSTIVFLVVAS